MEKIEVYHGVFPNPASAQLMSILTISTMPLVFLGWASNGGFLMISLSRPMLRHWR